METCNKLDAYVIMAGESIPSNDILNIVEDITTLTPLTNGVFRVEAVDCEAELHGIMPAGGPCERLWFRIHTPLQGFREFARTLASKLGWNSEIRWGLSNSQALLPPRVDSLTAIRQKRTGKGSLQAFDLISVTLVTVVTSYEVIRVPRSETWHMILAFMFMTALLACLLIALHFFYRSRSTDHAIYRWFVPVWLPVTLWYMLGGPTSWLPFLVVAVPGLCLGIALLILRRRAMSAGNAAASQVDFAFFKEALSGYPVTSLMKTTSCLVCGYSLDGLPSCRCPACDAMNHYLMDRPDAREAALDHGAILASADGSSNDGPCTSVGN